MWEVLAEFHIGLILRVILRVTKPIFMKLALVRQPTEFHEHPTKCSGPGPRQIAGRQAFFTALRTPEGQGKAGMVERGGREFESADQSNCEVNSGVEWLVSHSGHFTPGKQSRYPLERG